MEVFVSASTGLHLIEAAAFVSVSTAGTWVETTLHLIDAVELLAVRIAVLALTLFGLYKILRRP